MLYLQIPLAIIALFIVSYQITTLYWKRSISGWLLQLSVKYGLRISHKDLFYRKLMAYDKKKGVLVYLDMDRKEKGHVFGIGEIAECELMVHENNDSSKRRQNIDSIVLNLTLNAGNKIVSLPLYEDSFLARMSKKRVELSAARWYEQISSLISVDEEAGVLIA